MSETLRRGLERHPLPWEKVFWEPTGAWYVLDANQRDVCSPADEVAADLIIFAVERTAKEAAR